MVLAAFAQRDGMFDWIADRAVRIAGRSRFRLFALVYGAGIVTTAFLSNDATIVALTPAVVQALARYDAPPLPYVVACALVANAASFVLPISNPSNLLVFASGMPSLGLWLDMFALPSLAAIGVTFGVLAWRFAHDLRGTAARIEATGSAAPTRTGVALVAGSALLLVVVSAREGPLGLTTFLCAAVTWAYAVCRRRADALPLLREVSWPVIALTAGLFVVIAVVDAAGGLAAAHAALAWCARLTSPWSALAAGFVATAAANLANNLPAALLAGQTLPPLHPSRSLAGAVLVGINLGPNLTAHGSLATILWLSILRRHAIALRKREFLAIGLLAGPPALIAALLATAR